MADQVIMFRDFFKSARWLFTYMPINPYAQFEEPLVGRRHTKALLLYWLAMAFLLALLAGELWFLWHQIRTTNDIIEVAQGIAWLALTVMGIEATVMVLRKGPQITRIIGELDRLYTITLAETELIRSQYKMCNQIVGFYKTIWAGACIVVVGEPLMLAIVGYLMSGQWTFTQIMVIRYPFDPYQGYWIVVVQLWEGWRVVGSTVILSAITVLLGTIIMQIVLQFRILAKSLAALDLHSAATYHRDLQQLTILVQKHNELLRLAQDIQDAYSFSLLVNYLLSSVVICVFSFLIASIRDPSNLIIFFNHLFAFVSYNFTYSVFGQQLIDNVRVNGDRQTKQQLYKMYIHIFQSTIIADAAYQCNWFGSDLRVRKLLLRVMLRGQRPATLSGLGFFVVGFQSQAKVSVSYSHLTNTKSCSLQIMGTSYSYFTLLTTRYNT